MTGMSTALFIISSTTLFSAGSSSGRMAITDQAQSQGRANIVLPGLVALRAPTHAGPKLRLGIGPGRLRRFGVVASQDRAAFFEETNEDIYHENTKNPWHAFILGLAPGLFYKPLAMGLSWHYCDKKEDKRYIAFLNAVPASGFGSFYSEWYWAGALAMVADGVGSALITWYFYDDHQGRNDEGGSMMKFYAGIAVVASAWVFDIIMGPVGALYYNKTLRRKFLSEAPARRIYHMPPLPDTGLATVGFRPSARSAPVALGYAGRF